MPNTAADRFAGVEVITPANDEPRAEATEKARVRAELLAAMPKSWHDEVDAKLAASRKLTP
jgi:hypothetical protein